MSCTNSGPFDGGTYNQPTVVQPSITGGTATGTALVNPSITGGITVDATVANNLLQAIQEQTPVMVADRPESSTGTDLPTKVIGEDRSVVLGKPAGFMKIGAYLIPIYRAE